MVTPDGDWMEVERLDHNLGKIHDIAMARFKVSRYAEDMKTLIGEPEILEIAGPSFRKVGLGKDVTDKFLSGLPGIQRRLRWQLPAPHSYCTACLSMCAPLR